MVNKWVDNYRLTQRRPDESLCAEINDAQVARFADPLNRVPKSAEDDALAAHPGDVSAAMRELPTELREALYLADVIGYRNTEIAHLLDIPVGTVGSRLHRARSLLRGKLSETRAA